MNDRTYTNAAFDARMRRYMNDEYGSASPPPDSYAVLLARVKREETAQVAQADARPTRQPLRSPLSSLAALLHRAVSSRGLARVAPSAVALLLVLAVLGANVSDILRGSDHRFGGSPVALTVNEAGLRYGDSTLDKREIEFMEKSANQPDYVPAAEDNQLPVEAPNSIAPPHRNYYALQGTGPVDVAQPKTVESHKE